jgi:hypothetical protein
MIRGVHTEALLAAAYALFLALTALALEMVARYSHRRSQRIPVAGFRYHPQFDAWECPTGMRLPRAESDPSRRRVVYRAPAHVCNCCHIKVNCTDSSQGREIERSLDSWLESEIRRFHRGLSLSLLLLASAILTIEMAMHPSAADRDLLWSLLGLMVFLGFRMAKPLFTRAGEAEDDPATIKLNER